MQHPDPPEIRRLSPEGVPRQYEPALHFFKWLVLAVTLGPLLFCAGCIGLGAVLSFFSQPAGPPPSPPAQTAATAPPGTGMRSMPYEPRPVP